MSKSVLYAVNSSTQPFVATGTVVNYGLPVRRYGNNINVSGGNVVVDGIGYYSIDTNLTVTPSGAGTLLVQVYKDGVAIPGANITRTVAADTAYAVTIPAIIRQNCCCDSTITVEFSGVAGNISNAAMVAEKE